MVKISCFDSRSGKYSKFASTILVVFYGSIGVAAALAGYALWFIQPAPGKPITQVVIFLLIPVLLAAGAAAVRFERE